jgi:hypothetical protein
VRSSTGLRGGLLRESAADGESDLENTWALEGGTGSWEIAGYMKERLLYFRARIRRGRSVQTLIAIACRIMTNK